MNIETYGTGERLKAAARLSRNIQSKHLVLLPVPTSRDKVHVSGTDILLSDTLVNVGVGSTVVGYGLPLDYRSMAESLGGVVLDLSLDEEFLKENSRITAVGALGYLLTTSKSSPDALRIGVVGYGRIGSWLVRYLLFLGAKVRVYTSKMLTSLDLGECGVDSVCVCDSGGGVYDFSGLDILINTAPKDMRDSFPLGKYSDMRILELASGNNFDGVSGVERLPSLPEKMYPESAGAEYASAIERFLQKN